MKIIVIIKKELLKDEIVYNIKKIEIFEKKSIKYYLCIIRYKLKGFEIEVFEN